jgi:hypothetical protein
MRSFTSRRFREQYASQPEPVRSQALRAYRLFLSNPAHPGLNFKKVDEVGHVYSVRIGRGYRALGTMEGPEIIWFWIGPHSEYDRLL